MAQTMNDTIRRQAAIDAVEDWFFNTTDLRQPAEVLRCLPSAQPEKKVFGNMSDEEFEKWLYEHGICNPDIHESISCNVVPLLIDNAISELPSAQPEIIRCKDCKHRPSGDGVNHHIEFPDDLCPCQCEDFWYSWIPSDDWFCGNGERRE